MNISVRHQAHQTVKMDRIVEFVFPPKYGLPFKKSISSKLQESNPTGAFLVGFP